MQVKEKKRRGRPRTADYRKEVHRFSRIEDVFLAVVRKMETENDRKLVLEALETIKRSG
jgi:hypothetical protein